MDVPLRNVEYLSVKLQVIEKEMRSLQEDVQTEHATCEELLTCPHT